MSASPRRKYDLQRLGRFLSMLLRHQPARFPVKLDVQGYADLDAVMHVLKALPNFRWANRSDIDAVLALPGRARFELVESESGTKIRALYGHSAVRPDYDPVVPPPTLYYGTAPETAPDLLREGLTPRDHAYSHLVPTPDEARRSALRLSAEPVVLAVDAAAAHAAGIVFFAPTEGIYLVDKLPPQFLKKG